MTINEFPDGRAWSLISNHGHALVCIAQNPDVRLWELAQTIGVRERSAQRIVTQLVDAGYLTRHDHDHHGARITYTVNRGHHLRRPHLGAYTVGDLIDTFSRPPRPATRTTGNTGSPAMEPSKEKDAGASDPVPTPDASAGSCRDDTPRARMRRVVPR